MYTSRVITSAGRRPRTFAFMAVAAYLTVTGVAASFLLRSTASPGRFVSPIELAVLVMIFGLTVPVGNRPWTRTPATLLATVAADFALVATLLFLAPGPWMPAMLFFILIPVSSRLPPAIRFAFYAAAPLLTVAAILADGRFSEEWSSLASMVPGFVAMMVFSESFRAVREASQESNKLLDELVNAQGQLREVAVVEERQRLAQEMHDAVGHHLTVASIQLEAVCRLVTSDPERAAHLASVSRGEVRAALAELRAAVSTLSKEPVDARSLRRRIEETIVVFQQGCRTEVAAELDPHADELDASRATVLLRCVQEGLTNIQRHAQAAHAQVRLAVLPDEDRVELTIEDDGVGGSQGEADSAESREQRLSGGFGLRSLRERAAAVGGSLAFVHLESGSRLTVTIPIESKP